MPPRGKRNSRASSSSAFSPSSLSSSPFLLLSQSPEDDENRNKKKKKKLSTTGDNSQKRSTGRQTKLTATLMLSSSQPSSQPSTATAGSNSHNKNKAAAAKGNRRQSRKRVAPPARLAWPGQVGNSLSQQSSSISSPTQLQVAATQSSNSSATKKRSRVEPMSARQRQKQQHVSSANSSSTSSNNELWIDKHRPTQSSDLVVAPKKVKQVTEWLNKHSSPSSSTPSSTSSTSLAGLLLLIGAPGIGKSTMVHVLARELQLDVAEWTESFYQFETASNQSQMDAQSPLQHFLQFLKQNSIGYRALALQQQEDEDHTTNKPQSTSAKKKTKVQRQILARESTSASQQQRRLIVLDELPFCHSQESKDMLREALTHHVLHSTVPTVWIWSHNVHEGKQCNPSELEALVDSKVLYQNGLSTITTINPATLARFQSTFKRLAQRENKPISKECVAELHARSGGDIRYAMHALQFEYGGGNSGMNRSNNKHQKHQNKDEKAQTERDVRLSTFHSLGKVLYAKRKKDCATVNGEAPLDFDPEGALEHSGMELSGTIHFLQYHCLDFFTNVSELSSTWGLYSDAAVLLDNDRSSSSSNGTGLSQHAATSVAGRAVAYANRHPAPSKFRQFSKPRTFDVLAKRKANQWRLDHSYQRGTGRSLHTRQAFAEDIYPYGRKMMEMHQQQQSFLGSQEDDDDDDDDLFARSTHTFWDCPPLESFVGGSTQHADEIMSSTAQNDDALKQKEQEEILREDDIGEFDDDSEETFPDS